MRFLSICLSERITPKGMHVRFGKDALPKVDYLHKQVEDSMHTATVDIMHSCLAAYKSLWAKERSSLDTTMYRLFQELSYLEFESVYRHQLRLYKNSERKYWERKKKKT